MFSSLDTQSRLPPCIACNPAAPPPPPPLPRRRAAAAAAAGAGGVGQPLRAVGLREVGDRRRAAAPAALQTNGTLLAGRVRGERT
jgi:hypothetical protein